MAESSGTHTNKDTVISMADSGAANTYTVVSCRGKRAVIERDKDGKRYNTTRNDILRLKV